MINKYLLPFALLISIGFTAAVQAEEFLDNRWYIAPFGSYVKPGGDRNSSFDSGYGAGIGFGKTRSDNLKLLKYLPEFNVLGRPILTGPSRKSFLGQEGRGGAMDRLEETAAAVTAAIMNGSQVVRVHDVKAMKRVVAVADAIVRA